MGMGLACPCSKAPQRIRPGQASTARQSLNGSRVIIRSFAFFAEYAPEGLRHGHEKLPGSLNLNQRSGRSHMRP